jgi:hypothetical protein
MPENRCGAFIREGVRYVKFKKTYIIKRKSRWFFSGLIFNPVNLD